MSIVGLTICSWYTMLFMYYAYLNTKKQKLIILWMKITNQIPNYRIVGLSKRRNDEFWRKENKLFSFYLIAYRCFAVITTMMLCPLYLLIIFDVDIYLFVFVQLLHTVNLFLYICTLFHMVYT
jgi:hypothetical protein